MRNSSPVTDCHWATLLFRAPITSASALILGFCEINEVATASRITGVRHRRFCGLPAPANSALIAEAGTVASTTRVRICSATLTALLRGFVIRVDPTGILEVGKSDHDQKSDQSERAKHVKCRYLFVSD